MNREWHVEIRSSGTKLYGGFLTGLPETVLTKAMAEVEEKLEREEYEGEAVTWIGISASRRK